MDIDFSSTNIGGVASFPNSSKGRLLLLHCNNSCVLLQHSSSYKIRQNETSAGFKKRASHDHHASVAATGKSFRAAAHEVPSGPNPESN
ncbi:hypothetical protein AAHA92_19995 [Salvia divinorum]|uniref:Uncharacterized protein n=1 Tax=Salvia divinorum TaxID=28513 RepID=A0ABD1GJ25_SALDI